MATHHDDGLSIKESQINDEFLDVFGDIEGLLKRSLGRGAADRTPVSRLIDNYAERNPYWAQAARDLSQLRDIRNLLSHGRGKDHGFPVIVRKEALQRLFKIKRELSEQPPISASHKKSVVNVSPSDTLASLLKLAYAKQFSQFPVVEGELFQGIITENEIVRWLGAQVGQKQTEVDLEQINVKHVLKQKEPNRVGIPIFLFVPLNALEPEVMGLFTRRPMLEVLLLTQSGKKDTPIEGIVTQWDAARYAAR